MSSNADWIKLHGREQPSGDNPGSADGPHWEQLLNDLNAGKTIPAEEYREAAAELRPSFIRFMNSKNILVSGLRFIGSPMWTVHLLYSENATVREPGHRDLSRRAYRWYCGGFQPLRADCE